MLAALFASATVVVTATLIVWRERRRLRRHAAVASHELRRPLAAAMLGLTPEHFTKDRLFLVQGELAQAAAALEDFDRGVADLPPNTALRPTELGGTVAAVADAWRSRARSQGRVLLCDASATGKVWADPVRVAQALSNLVANSFEHGCGAVTLWLRELDGQLCIGVRDEGPGWRLPDTRRHLRVRRRGHGLEVVRAIANSHNGELANFGKAGVALSLPLLEVSETPSVELRAA